MKINMVNKNRKGGKFDKSVSDEMYVVENFLQNGTLSFKIWTQMNLKRNQCLEIN